ncbi:MAG TPA: hypothetical protein VF151_09745 [Gemmatimonadales bacterium]
MTLRIYETVPGRFAIATEAGNLIHTTAGEVFVTSDLAEAEEALAYLSQPVEALATRQGSHRLKSMFGVL